MNGMKVALRFLLPLPLAACLALLPAGLRADQEDDLIRVLQSEAGIVAKAEACRQLRTLGSRKSIPVLGSLLEEERLSQAARYALETLPDPEASAVLRKALGSTVGRVKSGVIESLAWRRDPEAVPFLGPLLVEVDPDIAAAAASALGRIGGEEALAALEAGRDRVAADVRPALLEGLMREAERLATRGQRDGAIRIYRSLTKATEAESVRMAAWSGWIRASGSEARSVILSALEGTDEAAQMAALGLAGEIRDPAMTSRLAALIAPAPPGLRLALLDVLRQRGDAAARDPVLDEARRSDGGIRAAALAALGSVGDASVLPVLLEAAASTNQAEQLTARDSLVVLSRGDVTTELIRQLPSVSPTLQREVFRALTGRGDKAAVPPLMVLAADTRSPTREAVMQTLGNLVDGSHVDALAGLLVETRDPAARDEIRGVFEMLVERFGDPGEIEAGPLVTRLTQGDSAAKKALLPVAALFVDERARSSLRAALEDGDPEVRSAAVLAVANSRDAALLPDLLEIARKTTDPTLRSRALEGCVRLATEEGGTLSAAGRAEVLTRALAAAGGVADQRRVLSGLARVPDRRALETSEKAMADPAVRPEAEAAMLQIARGLASVDWARAEAALARLAAEASSPTVRGNAQALRNQLDSGWVGTGPFRQAGKAGEDLFGVAFAPELTDGGPSVWQRLPGSPDPARPGEVDLSGLTQGDHCVVYARTRVHVPVARDVTLVIGSDDGIKIWVNGELVHANNAVRGLAPGQDRARGRLRQGWNDLLAKVTQHTAGCGFILQMTTADGRDVPGLRLDPRGGQP